MTTVTTKRDALKIIELPHGVAVQLRGLPAFRVYSEEFYVVTGNKYEFEHAHELCIRDAKLDIERGVFDDDLIFYGVR